MTILYVLNNKKPVRALNTIEWGNFYGSPDRSVNKTRFLLTKKRELIKRRKRLKTIKAREAPITIKRKHRKLLENSIYHKRRRLKGAEFGVVSTVFLGIDHGWGDEPMFFETMVFEGKYDQLQARCPDWDSAEIMHHSVVNMIRGNSDYENREI